MAQDLPTSRLSRWRPTHRSSQFVLGAVSIGLAGSWLWNRWREQPLEVRTRERLAPRSLPDAAADIIVAAR